jgi:hypothetical protein
MRQLGRERNRSGRNRSTSDEADDGKNDRHGCPAPYFTP